MPGPRRSTATSSFGVSRREGHDASAFYARFAPPAISDDATVVDRAALVDVVDRLHAGDSRRMAEVPDGSVALVVTSPPYFAGKEYEQDLGTGHVPATYLDYLAMLRDVFAECVRVLEPGGRLVVNVANLGRRPYRSLSADVTSILQDDLRLLLRGEVIWQKQRGATGSCAWGSYRSSANPVLRDTSERLVIASKGRFDRALDARERARRQLPSQPTITGDEFLEATLDVWELPAESATRVGHPAPFPVALVERCVHLYTYEGDLVLDPFMGSGSTAVAAVRTGRHFVGYDADPAYVELAERRVAEERARLAARPRPPADPRTLKERAAAVLAAAGFDQVTWKPRVASGVEVAGQATDPAGRTVLFELAGGITSSRSGLQRAEVLWRTIGKAAVVHAVVPHVPFVVFAAELPSRAGGGAALDAVTGPGRPVTGVIDVTAADAVERLRACVVGTP